MDVVSLGISSIKLNDNALGIQLIQISIVIHYAIVTKYCQQRIASKYCLQLSTDDAGHAIYR